VFTLATAGVLSAKGRGMNLQPLWGFDKAAATAQGAATQTIGEFAHHGTAGILSAILATFAIAPWAFVGFDTIPQAAEEFNFSYKKVSLIMVIAIVFGCFVYTANNTIAAAALSNWPELIIHADSTPWLLLTAAEHNGPARAASVPAPPVLQVFPCAVQAVRQGRNEKHREMAIQSFFTVFVCRKARPPLLKKYSKIPYPTPKGWGHGGKGAI